MQTRMPTFEMIININIRKENKLHLLNRHIMFNMGDINILAVFILH